MKRISVFWVSVALCVVLLSLAVMMANHQNEILADSETTTEQEIEEQAPQEQPEEEIFEQPKGEKVVNKKDLHHKNLDMEGGMPKRVQPPAEENNAPENSG